VVREQEGKRMTPSDNQHCITHHEACGCRQAAHRDAVAVLDHNYRTALARLDIEKADNARLRGVLHDIESFTIDCKPGDYTADVVGHTIRKALNADQETTRG
jgi:hypothetical protein